MKIITTIKQALASFFLPYGVQEPHGLNINFEFAGYADPKIKVSMNPRFEEVYQDYQTWLRKYVVKHFPGPMAEKIMHGYHHPVATIPFMVDNLKKGDLPDHPVPHDHHYMAARRAAADAFRPPKRIRPVHFADLRYYNWNWHPNVEEPYYSDPKLQQYVEHCYSLGLIDDARLSFGNLKDFVFMDTRHYLHLIKDGKITDPNQLWPIMKIHVKPALTTPDETKIRVIYGVSKRHILCQAMFFWPLFRYYIESKASPLLWGNETFTGGMSRLHDMMSIPRLYFKTFVTIDWSGFDLRSLFSIQREIFDDWREYFDLENGYIPTRTYHSTKTDPIRMERLWNWQRDACFNMPFVMPDRTTYNRRYRCIPSGLFVTQFLDSHYNLIMIYTILSRMGIDITNLKIEVQGDDSLTFLRFYLPPNQHEQFKLDFQKWATYYFDHVARPEKTSVHNTPQGVEVLGYTNNNGYPVRDQIKLMAQLYHPRNVDKHHWKSLLMAKVCGFAYASVYQDRTVIGFLRDIYLSLERKGFQPKAGRVMRDVVLFGETEFEVPIDHFPTEMEVTRHLRFPYARTDKDRDNYFPSWHFSATE
ncbi:RNA-dependent RNA polymerase [Drechslerella stenobrocha partitivirus 1]|nr:RNA-dependent RNA polymerase [Drechslerella stenobrocha partitivirus 1]